MRATIGIAMLLLSFLAAAQNVQINDIEIAGSNVIVHYSLEDSNPNNEYQLNLYASRDDFSTPLTKISGDVGNEVSPGTNKRITWNIKEEYPGFNGKIALEVRGSVYAPFVKLKDFNSKIKYKRGKNYNLVWKSGASNPINIELYKGGQRIAGEMNQPNNGAHTFFIPEHSKPGKDYRLKITDSRNPSDIINTGNFKVVPKIPLLLKLLPIVAIGGAAAFLAGSGGGEPDPGVAEIPGVPALPGG